MGAKKSKPDLMDVAIDLKMSCRQLEKQSMKVESLEKAERKKVADVQLLLKTILGSQQRSDGKC